MAKEKKEFKNKSKEELKNILAEQRELLRELKFKDANRQLKNIREIRVVKKYIAKILTELNKKDEPRKKDQQ